MTSSPDLIHELRASRPSAPLELRGRVRKLASTQPKAAPWASWRFPLRRGLLVAVPAAAALALASAGVVGLSRSDVAQQSLARDAQADKTTLESATPSGTAGDLAPTQGATDATTGDRAQRVSATLTVEVSDSDAVSRAAQDALDLTRSLGGFVVSSSVATGEEGTASITVRVPVAKVQDAITGLSGLGRIVSQQVTIDDLQATLDQLQRREATVRSEIARIRARLRTETLDAQTEAVLRARLQTLRGELTELRTGIASTEAEARMSTIQLTVVTPGAFGGVAPASRIDRTIDEALNVLAWEAVVVLALLIVLAPFALVGAAAWLGRRLYRRHEDERLLALESAPRSRSRRASQCAAMAGERKIATMLFADLVGSTEMASSSDPEHTRLLLDRFYDAMAEEIEATGGTIEKFAGDAVLAVFGVPVAHEDHAERALHTAIAMRARLRDLFGGQLQLRIGVNTGEVVVGTPRRGSSFVSGDPVNVAARLEQGAAPGQILVGERTATVAGAAFEFSDPETIAAKGKHAGVVARRLVAALAVTRPRGRLGDTFVGRSRELDALEAAYRRVVERRVPELVVVAGDAGVGKSALLGRAAAQLSRAAEPPVVRTARCPSYGRGLTYRPLGDVLRHELELLESDPPEHALERLGNRPILGLALGLEVAQGAHPVVVRERFHAAWVELLGERAAEQPLVLVIEDLHWAEEPLLELLRDVRRRVVGPLLLVATARPEAAAAVTADVRLDLAPLSTSDASEIVARLLGSGLPPEVSALVVTRAEGNPFFLQELLATLIDRGTIRRHGPAWELEGRLDELDLPDTVQAVLASRIDLLPEAEKRALQTASVIGRVFWEEPVRALMGDVHVDLRELVDREFVLAQTESSLEGQTEYVFRHQLTREVAYSSLPKAERGRLHAAVADRLESGRNEALAALLAHHYEQAVKEDYAALAWPDDPDELSRLTERALSWLRVAAERATSRYEAEAAVAMLERALELAPDAVTRFELWRALADVQSLRYHTRGFVSATEHAIDLAPDDETVTELYAELALRSSTAWLAWNPPLAREVVEGWIEEALARAAPASRERAMALVARAWHAYRAEETVGEALAIAERVGDPELIGWALRVHVIACMQSGRYDTAAAGATRILALLDRVQDPGNRETLIENTALRVAAATGRFDEARRFSDLVSDIVQDLTPHNRLHAAAYAVEIEELTANWDRIHELGSRVERAVDDNRDTPCVRNARSLLVCALAETARSDHGQAQRFVELASTVGVEGHDRELTAPRLRMALLRGDAAEAHRLLGQYGRPTLRFMFDMAGATAWLDAAAALGLRTAVEDEAPFLAQPGTCLEPFALRALGIVRDDPDLVDRAGDCFASLGLRWHAEHAPPRF